MCAELFAKGVDPIRFDLQPGRRLMSAKRLQVMSTRRQPRVQIEPSERAARSVTNAILSRQRDQNRGLLELLSHAAGHNADDPAMPLLVGEHQRGTFQPRGILGDHLFRLLQDFSLDRLPLLIQAIEMFRENECSLRIVGRQQLHREPRLSQSSSRVDARADREANVVGSKFLLVSQTADLHQRLHARTATLDKTAQSVPHDRAILIDQRHAIGHGSDRREPNRAHQEFAHRR